MKEKQFIKGNNNRQSFSHFWAIRRCLQVSAMLYLLPITACQASTSVDGTVGLNAKSQEEQKQLQPSQAESQTFSSEHWLEIQRSKGRSAHLSYQEFETEDVLLNRADLVREAKAFFELVNAARSNPQKTLEGCENCLEKTCYKPVSLLQWDESLASTAHFHALHLVESLCVDHESSCEFKEQLGDCDGHPTCACLAPLELSCGSGINSFERLKLLYPNKIFSHVGENLVASAGGSLSGEEMMQNLYWEKASTHSCDPAQNSGNGHRLNILNPEFKRMGAAIYCTSETNAVIQCVGVQMFSD